MFTSSPLTLNPPISTIANPLLSSPRSPSLSHLSTATSRQRVTITAAAAATATFLEPIPVNSRKTMSLYEILRIKQTASLMEIKTAYRRLAKLYHPDAIIHEHDDVQSDGRDFMEIHNAYETLADPASRALYDLSLEASAAAARRRRTDVGYYTTRRWETDQCW